MMKENFGQRLTKFQLFCQLDTLYMTLCQQPVLYGYPSHVSSEDALNLTDFFPCSLTYLTQLSSLPTFADWLKHLYIQYPSPPLRFRSLYHYLLEKTETLLNGTSLVPKTSDASTFATSFMEQWLEARSPETYERYARLQWYRQQWEQAWKKLTVPNQPAVQRPIFGTWIRRIFQLRGVRHFYIFSRTSPTETWIDEAGLVEGDEGKTQQFLTQQLQLFHAPTLSLIVLAQSLGVCSRGEPFGKIYLIEMGNQHIRYFNLTETEQFLPRLPLFSLTSLSSFHISTLGNRLELTESSLTHPTSPLQH